MNAVHWFVTCDSKFEEPSDRNCGCPAESDAQDIAGVAEKWQRRRWIRGWLWFRVLAQTAAEPDRTAIWAVKHWNTIYLMVASALVSCSAEAEFWALDLTLRCLNRNCSTGRTSLMPQTKNYGVEHVSYADWRRHYAKRHCSDLNLPMLIVCDVFSFSFWTASCVVSTRLYWNHEMFLGPG